MSGGWVVHEKQNKADVHAGCSALASRRRSFPRVQPPCVENSSVAPSLGTALLPTKPTRAGLMPAERTQVSGALSARASLWIWLLSAFSYVH